MPDPSALPPEDTKLITLARSAQARTRAAQGAAVRDTAGRTWSSRGMGAWVCWAMMANGLSPVKGGLPLSSS